MKQGKKCGRCSKCTCTADAPADPIMIFTPANCQKLSCLQHISGSAAPESKVTVTVCGCMEFEAITDDCGRWCVCVGEGLEPGFCEIRAAYAGSDEYVSIWVYIREPYIPPAPVVTFPTQGAVVPQTGFVVTGTALPGAIVTACDSEVGCAAAYADETGAFSIQFQTTLPVGAHQISVFQQVCECTTSAMTLVSFTVSA